MLLVTAPSLCQVLVVFPRDSGSFSLSILSNKALLCGLLKLISSWLYSLPCVSPLDCGLEASLQDLVVQNAELRERVQIILAQPLNR